ncbi:hypothetical protein GCM10027592_02790 [Spirosoma flavus]
MDPEEDVTTLRLADDRYTLIEIYANDLIWYYEKAIDLIYNSNFDFGLWAGYPKGRKQYINYNQPT